MSFPRNIWSKLRSLVQQRKIKEDIDEELRFHIEMREQENLRAGMSPKEARQEALRRFGNVQTLREECRDVRGSSFGESVLQDVRFGARMLRKNPGFTAIAILTLALGIGANTAIFSFINAILLQPLPYPEAEQIVTSRSNQNISPAELFAWQKEGRALDAIAVYSFVFYSMPGNPDPERVKGVRSSPGLFSALRVNPHLGRDFREEEVFHGTERVMMLGYDLWKRRFNGDKDLIGEAVSIGGDMFTLIGVAPPGFNYPDGAEFWTPSEFVLGERLKGPLAHLLPKNTPSRSLRSVARLAPGMTLQQANAELDVITARLDPEQAKSGQMPVARFVPLQEDMVGKVRPVLVLLLGSVGLVLLVACANVANLLLARAVTRQKEIALRCALGAGPWRIFRQLLSESILLSVLGGVAGLLLAVYLAKVFLLIAPPNVPRLQEVRIDGTVLGFSLVIAMLCGILVGLLPAFQAFRINLLKTLNDGSKGVRGGISQRTRNVLVIAEIAIAIVLLTGAGLLVQSLARLQRIDLGFKAKNLMLVPMAGMCDFRWNLLERVRAVPGDYSVAVVDFAPGGGLPGVSRFRFANESPETARSARVNKCSADYFKTMGIPILRGREFERYEHRKIASDPDSGTGPLVAVVNDVFVQRYLPDEEPLQKQIYLGAQGTNALTIVGVAKANRYSPAYAPEPEVFVLFPQHCGSRPLMLMIRSQSDLRNVMTAVRKEARGVDNNVAIGDGMTMETQMSQLLAQQKFQMTLLVGLAITALVLAAVGIYGVLAYAVTQRTQEIGIRMALGAQRSEILWLVVKQGMKLAFIGVGIGIIAAIGLNRFIKSFLFGVTPTDPLTFITITILLLAIALVACWLPARRATKVHPMVALRYE